MLLLAIASTVGFVTALSLNQRERHRAEAIAMVSSQRALSQRIALLTSRLDQDREPERLREELHAAIARMRRQHDVLTLGASADVDLTRFLSPIQGLYLQGYLPFDRQVRTFLERAETVSAAEPGSDAWQSAALDRYLVVGMGTDALPQSHALIVQVMQADAEAALTKGRWVDGLLWLSALGLIGAIAIFIFGPMGRRVADSIDNIATAEARARQAARSADAERKAKGAFLHAAGHELKTPLNALIGFADIIRQENVSDKADEALQEMQFASDHLLGLIDAILDAHRAEEGTLTLNEEAFCVAEPLEAASRITEGLCRRKGLGLEACIDVPTTSMVFGDAVRLRQICLNLLDNAVKFTEAGSVGFEASVAETEGVLTLSILVTDTGMGIPAARQSAVFERYAASEDAVARGVGGLGIGLSTTKTLVGLMGGEIALRSEEGAGTEVSVTIPLAKVVPAAPALEAPERDGPIRVLIVDDNAPNRMVAEAMVKIAGGEAVLGCDGVEAVEAANADWFDLILMDISMPRMDGIEATAIIREDGPNMTTPIIAVTAHVAREEVPDLLDQGFDEVIHKPIRKDLIADAMMRWTGPGAAPLRRTA
nr:response regulator [Parvularcula dongshanensis]